MAELTGKNSFKIPKVLKYTTKGGDTAYLRVMSGKERDEWHAVIKAEKAKPEDTPCQSVYATLCVRTLSDQRGNRIYEDTDAPQFAADTDSKLLAELFEKAMEWNRLTEDAEGKEKKDLSLTPTPTSGSDSPEN